MKIFGRWHAAVVVLILSAAMVTGCGGGGSSSSSIQQTPATSSVSGVASKGLLSGATVTAYSLNASGVKGPALGSAKTDAQGAYSINLGSYTGSVILEANGGSYTDEATGSTITNTVLLRAAVTNVSGNVTAAVTPLTEIAVQKAGALTAANIDVANTLVSNIIGGTNIITTMPVNVLVSSSSTTAAKNYGLALAAISQMVSDGTATNVASAITGIAADLADNQLDATGPDLSTALGTFITGTSNQTGLSTTTAPVVTAVTNATGNATTILGGTYRHIDQSVGFYTYVSNSTTYGAGMSYGDTVLFAIASNGTCTIVSGSGTTYDMFPSTNTITSTTDTFGTVPCSYTLASNGSVTFDINGSPFPGYVSIDGNVILHGSASANGTLRQSEQSIEIKTGTGMSSTSLNGSYAMVSQSIGFHTYSSPSGTKTASNFYGDSSIITFDGAGNFTSTGSGWFYEMFHTTNTIGQNQELWSNEPGTYTVSNDGTMSVAGMPWQGWVSADGNIIILGGAYVDGDIRASEQDVAVKLGTSMNNASLNGTFKAADQISGFNLVSSITGTMAESMGEQLNHTIVFNGTGGCTWTIAYDSAIGMSGNTIFSDTSRIGETHSCTYSVTSNGTVTLTLDTPDVITAWLSANGNILIWGGGGWSDQNHTGGVIREVAGQEPAPQRITLDSHRC